MKPCGGCAKRREKLKALAARVVAAVAKKPAPKITAEQPTPERDQEEAR